MKVSVSLFILIVIFGLLSSLMLASVATHEAIGQSIYVVVGLVAFWGVHLISPQAIQRLALPGYAIVLISLLLTLVVGTISKGSMRWIPIGPVHVQTSELAKPALALALAAFATKVSLSSQKSLAVALGMIMLFAGPVFIQPDLGSALIIFVIGAALVFYTITNLRLLLPWIALGLVSVAILWQFVLYDYQKQRIYSFLSPDTYQSSSAYNANQALIAVGSGKILGRGFGHGVQSTLQFLPEHHTDFFFASFAEEMGFVGVLLLLALYGALFGVLLFRSQKLSRFAQLYIYAYSSGIFAQMLIHMGMNMHLLPVTGIPLPLLSSGGSSFVSTCLGLGLAAVLHRLEDQWAENVSG